MNSAEIEIFNKNVQASNVNENLLFQNDKILYGNDANLTAYMHDVTSCVYDYLQYLAVLWGIFVLIFCTIIYFMEKKIDELDVRVKELEERLPENQPLLDYPDKA